MDIVVRRRGLGDVPKPEHREKAILLGASHADMQARVYTCEAAALTTTDQYLLMLQRRESANTTIVRDKRPFTTGATNWPLSWWRVLGVSRFIDQLAASKCIAGEWCRVPC